ncbi:MAG TPA: hypothetical protein VHE35_13730 [Kofleriaceae bacterium]|nr:hypothetical protein [Kofleriaceae bacterium]
MLVRGPDPLETLPRSIRRPRLFKVGRWAACPLSERGARPGKTRLEVVMWLPVGDSDDGLPTWKDVAAVLGPPLPAGPLTLPRAALEVVAPDVTAVPVDDERVTITGDVYPSRGFEGHGSTMARSVRLNGGLLVTLSTT